MSIWRITFRPDPGSRRLITDVEAEYLELERYGPHAVLWRTQLVVGRLQQVIVWRVRRDEVTIEQQCAATQPISGESTTSRQRTELPDLHPTDTGVTSL